MAGCKDEKLGGQSGVLLVVYWGVLGQGIAHVLHRWLRQSNSYNRVCQ